MHSEYSQGYQVLGSNGQADLAEAGQRCNTCQESPPVLQKDPMMLHPIPQSTWQAVASDCFEVEGQNYVILVDLHSD